MIVEPYGELRFLVSDNMDSKDKYLVDLAWYGGNSKCNCFSFNVHHAPRLEGVNPARPGYEDQSYRCKHILFVHAMIGAKVIYNAINTSKISLTAGNHNY